MEVSIRWSKLDPGARNFKVEVPGDGAAHQITMHPPTRLFGHTGLGHEPSGMPMEQTRVPKGQANSGGR